MPSFAPSSLSHEHSATLRQLKVLVVVLVLSNIGLGLFAVYLLRSTDQRYSVLIGRSVPILNEFRALTGDMAGSMRLTGTPLLDATSAGREDAVRKARNALASEQSFRDSFLQEQWPAELPDPRGELRQRGDAFDALCERIIGLAASDRIEDAIRARNGELAGAYDAYAAAIERAAQTVQGASLKANDAMSARTGSMSTVVLGLAGWPVIVLAALLVLTAIFVVVLMVLFRGREMSDMP